MTTKKQYVLLEISTEQVEESDVIRTSGEKQEIEKTNSFNLSNQYGGEWW